MEHKLIELKNLTKNFEDPAGASAELIWTFMKMNF